MVAGFAGVGRGGRGHFAGGGSAHQGRPQREPRKPCEGQHFGGIQPRAQDDHCGAQDIWQPGSARNSVLSRGGIKARETWSKYKNNVGKEFRHETNTDTPDKENN